MPIPTSTHCETTFNTAASLSSGTATTMPPRRVIAEFCKNVGREILSYRIYQDATGYACERQIVDADGSSFTQSLPFLAADRLKEFIQADTYYATARLELDRLLRRAASAP